MTTFDSIRAVLRADPERWHATEDPGNGLIQFACPKEPDHDAVAVEDGWTCECLGENVEPLETLAPLLGISSSNSNAAHQPAGGGDGVIMLDHALAYADRGWRVFPIHPANPPAGCSCGAGRRCSSPGKHPLSDNGLKDATTDEGVIRKWWDRWPNANVGIATGAGLYVLDDDPAKNGDASLAELEQEHGEIPDTLEVQTGGNGLHIYLRVDRELRNTAGKLGAGLDTRGDGGYVVAPPSLHASGRRYSWRPGHGPDDVEIAVAPAWLLGRLDTPTTNGAERPAPVDDVIEEGGRNDRLFRLACSMRRKGLTHDEIMPTLRTVNARRCQPPLDEAELQRIAWSAENYAPEPEPTGNTEPDRRFAARPFDPDAESDVELLVDPNTIRFGRFLEADPPPRRSLLEDVLPIPIAALLGSIGGTGKSTLIYQLGMSVCAPAPFLGLPISEAGSALLLFSEDDEAELHRRGRILLDHYRESGRFIDIGALSERLHVVSRVACNNLLTRAGADGEALRTPIVDRLIATAERIPDLKLIGIDPASRFRGGNANSEEHVTRFVEAIEAIRDATGATVICAAHATKLSALTGDSEQGMVRGSSALVDGFRWVATAVKMTVQQAEAFGVDAGERRRYLRLEIPKSNYTAPFGGLWLERIPGGVLVPAELDDVPTTDRRRAKHDTEYRDILDRVKELIAEVGPLSRGAIRPYSGRMGRLCAGDKTVRAVIERAVSEAELTDNGGRLEIPETERKAT